MKGKSMAERLSLSTENKSVCLSDRIKQYIDLILSRMDSSEEAKSKAYKIYKIIRGDIFINGRDPRPIAAAIVYIAESYFGTNQITQETISYYFDVNVNSIGKAYRDIRRAFPNIILEVDRDGL
jgi:transcription initiation factor TFIIIB Brf1 subunit/transcription initiation factor TFIIB